MFLRILIKRILLLGLIFTFWAGCALSLAAGSRDVLSVPGLAVTDFTGSGFSVAERELLSDLFAYLCAKSGRYFVLERNERDKILARKGRPVAKPRSLKDMITLGTALNVDFILSGEVTVQNGLWVLKLSLIDVNKGMVSRHWQQEYPTAR